MDVDVWNGALEEFREFQLRKDPACPVCGESPTQKELVDYDALCAPRPEDRVREAALKLDLVDVKVAAVDHVWSGLKLVIRKERR